VPTFRQLADISAGAARSDLEEIRSATSSASTRRAMRIYPNGKMHMLLDLAYSFPRLRCWGGLRSWSHCPIALSSARSLSTSFNMSTSLSEDLCILTSADTLN